MRVVYLPLLVIGSLALGGCVAGVAASAVGAAVNASQPRETNEDLRRPAVAACTARAIEHGEVHIIDAEQRRGGRVTVWGTVTTSERRQAFECRYNGQVSDFDLRVLPQR